MVNSAVLEKMSPDAKALLTDPKAYKAARKALRSELRGSLEEDAAQIVADAVKAACDTVTERTGKRVKSVVVHGDGSVTVRLLMRAEGEPEGEADAADAEVPVEEVPAAAVEAAPEVAETPKRKGKKNAA